MSDDSSSNIDWESIDKLKRPDLQKICKELKLNIKGTAKNADLIAAILEYKNTNVNSNTTTSTDTQQTIVNISEIKQEKETKVKKEKTNNKEEMNIDNDNTQQPVQNEQEKEEETEQKKEQEQEKEKEKEQEQEQEKEEEKEEEKEQEQVQEEEKEQEIEQEQVQEEEKGLNNNEEIVQNEIMNNSKNGNDTIKEEDKEKNKFLETLLINDKDKEVEMDNDEEKNTHIGLKFRNYIPKDSTFLKYKIEKATAPEIAKELMSRLRVLEENQDIQISFVPKKVNWDLKRDCSKKLAKLEKQTEKAIYQLIKQKLGKEDINESNVYLFSKNMEKLNF